MLRVSAISCLSALLQCALFQSQCDQQPYTRSLFHDTDLMQQPQKHSSDFCLRLWKTQSYAQEHSECSHLSMYYIYVQTNVDERRPERRAKREKTTNTDSTINIGSATSHLKREQFCARSVCVVLYDIQRSVCQPDFWYSILMLFFVL